MYLRRDVALIFAASVIAASVGCSVPHHIYMDDSGKNTRHHGTVAACENLELLLLDVVGCFYHRLCHIVRNNAQNGPISGTHQASLAL